MATNNDTNLIYEVFDKFVVTGFLRGCGYGGVTTTTKFASTASRSRAWPFILPSGILVNKIIFEVVATAVGSHGSVGIYDQTGTILLIDSGAQDTSVAGVKIVTLATPVWLAPGMYIVGATCTSTTPSIRGVTINGTNTLMSAVVSRIGTSAVATVNGVLPSSLGVIASAFINIPSILLSTE